MTLVSPLNEAHSHPSLEELERAAQSVMRWALDHHATLAEQPIGLTGSPAEMSLLLAESPPEAGRPFSEVLARFETQVAKFAFRANHPRFLAFVPGAPVFPSVLGDWLCAAANFFCGVWLEAAGPTQVELTVLDWFKQWLGYPKQAHGLLTGGGSEANLTALVVARERIPFADRGRCVLYVSEQRHLSVDRAAMVMGLHPGQVRPIPTGADLKSHAPALRRLVQADRAEGRLPWAVVANAGSTNAGTVDPLSDLADACRAEKLWLHVDAAYGWAAMLTAAGKRELAGIEAADSITLDPHKWLAQTFEAGCLLVREGNLLEETFSLRPDYMQDVTPEAGEVNFADCGIALTRRFRALKIWLSVQVLGTAWFRDLVDRSCRLAERAEQLLGAAGCFEILHSRQLSIVCFRYRREGMPEEDLDRRNERIARDLLATQRAFISSTRVHGKFALRMCFINWRTTAADVEEIVELMQELGARQ
jgi:glutamate/tyrosine decarboxylase-like PLP-dependent enzyme